jgi:hypothetical protein
LDFLSQNHEIKCALKQSRQLFEQYQLRFVGDAGLDDQKIFGWVAECHSEFVIRASQLDRVVEIYNPVRQLDRVVEIYNPVRQCAPAVGEGAPASIVYP